MRLLGPTPVQRLNEAAGLVFLLSSIFLTLSLVSYHPSDPSWNTATGLVSPGNLTGSIGSHLADLLLQAFGLASFLLPFFLVALGWKWIRSRPIESPIAKVFGAALMLGSAAAALSLFSGWRLFGGAILPGGVVGMFSAAWLVSLLNTAGTILVLAASLLVSLYLVSSFSLFRVSARIQAALGVGSAAGHWWRDWRKKRRAAREHDAAILRERAQERARRMAEHLGAAATAGGPAAPAEQDGFEPIHDIPIRTQEDLAPPPSSPAATAEEAETPKAAHAPRLDMPYSPPAVSEQAEFRLPSTELLNPAPARNTHDEQELKELAAAIKAKFEEFNVFGSVVQINHGPVVTTFEFKPDAGVKYSRITTLTDDLCLGLRAESILIERIPGRPTVGIEVPNTRRELISLREVLESDVFVSCRSRLPVPLGKDINGRIKVASLEAMPHLLIAGSTGSGKSVLLNSMLVSMLYRATPDQVRLVLVDPKRVELGIYEGVPHLLTPVITDPKKATNALRNAVLEMERRLKLLAARGVRNIEQYNRKTRQLLEDPGNLFPEDPLDELKPLPYVVIVIDELSDLMMVERANVEAAVTRLAQMARAVGMHLVLATQRPSVDVITGLIKANFPARISFRVATRVDSRTVLDVMGAERLLGNGDMLFLPPGSARLIRMHGAFVTEEEITGVVEFWKNQAAPDYDETLLLAPPSEEAGAEGGDGEPRSEDPAYEDAVRVVLEMGKASTSILQRRLRLGYGRAARLLDMMEGEGIIGPPDGSRPREVLKAPDWLREVEEQLR